MTLMLGSICEVRYNNRRVSRCIRVQKYKIPHRCVGIVRLREKSQYLETGMSS